MCYFNNEIVSPPTLWDPMDICPPGSSVHGISQARILEWLAISYFRGSFQPRDQTQVSCIAGRFFTIQVTRESSKVIILIIALLRYNSHTIQLIYQQYSIQWILVCSQNSAPFIIVVAQSCLTLCHPMDCSLPGSSVHGIFQARILEWLAISFSRESSWPRDRTQVSSIADRRLTVWGTRES